MWWTLAVLIGLVTGAAAGLLAVAVPLPSVVQSVGAALVAHVLATVLMIGLFRRVPGSRMRTGYWGIGLDNLLYLAAFCVLVAGADIALGYAGLPPTLAPLRTIALACMGGLYGALPMAWLQRAVAQLPVEPIEVTVVEAGGVKAIETSPNYGFMFEVEDAARVVESCFSTGTRCALLYPDNLTARFFDLSSGEAGAILQKLRNYGVRLAVVCEPGRVRVSSRFGEFAAEERRGRHFGVFDTRDDALKWLGDG